MLKYKEMDRKIYTRPGKGVGFMNVGRGYYNICMIIFLILKNVNMSTKYTSRW